MGRHLWTQYPLARTYFERADAALGETLSKTIFEGPEADLNRTANTQPAVLTMACAAHAVLAARGFVPDVVAGHSLGEYSALVSAGALDFEDAVRLCRRRGTYMQAAVPEGRGAMAAIQRLEPEVVAQACSEVDGYCEPAVYNAPKLVIISGETEAVAAASAKLAEMRAIVIPLAVSAPFHCAMLRPAAAQLAADLATIEVGPLTVPYISNIDAKWHDDASPDVIRDNLVRQVVGAVRWRSSISLMLERGVERFWHVGPGRANLTHVKRQARKAPMATLDNEAQFRDILGELEDR